MSSKSNPGKYNCYEKAHPDEPMFVLLGRDPCAPQLVLLWAEMRKLMGSDPEKIAEAEQCADAMRAWLTKLGKDPVKLKGEMNVVQETSNDG